MNLGATCFLISMIRIVERLSLGFSVLFPRLNSKLDICCINPGCSMLRALVTELVFGGQNPPLDFRSLRAVFYLHFL